MNSLFKLDESAAVSDVTGYLSLLVYQSIAVQTALHELSWDKKCIEDNFDAIGGLVAQNEDNLGVIKQITEFLERSEIKVVKK